MGVADHAAPTGAKQYGKFFVQVGGAVVAAIVAAATGNGQIDAAEWINVLIAGLGAIAVIGAGETTDGFWSKAKLYVSAATAGAVFLSSVISDGVSTAEWWQLATVLLTALGVNFAPAPVVKQVRQISQTP